MNGEEPSPKRIKLNGECDEDQLNPVDRKESETSEKNGKVVKNEEKVKEEENKEENEEVEQMASEFNEPKSENCQLTKATVAAAPSTPRLNEEHSPQIFKLDDNCFDEIFNYSSYKDLLSFGRTCKTLQSYVSDYYRRHFSYRNSEIEPNGMIFDYAFNPAVEQFITRLQIRFNSFQPLYSINSRIEQFSLLKHITLSNMDLVEPDYDRMRNIFNKIESLHLRSCLPAFCTRCLDLCRNLKRISMRHIISNDYEEDTAYPWLFGCYPKLEYFEFSLVGEWPIVGLNGFLEKNESIRTFSTSGLCLWINRDQFLNSNAKLDVLEIRMMDVYGVSLDEFAAAGTRVQTICRLINRLYERGFYQRLHFFITDDDQISNIGGLASLQSLEKLCINEFKKSFSLHPLTLVKELVIVRCIEHIDLEHLANECGKLERLFVDVPTINDIMPFVRHSAKLSKITLLNKCVNRIFLAALNKEREKLATARKLTIFISDDVYVDTKRTTKNGDVSLSHVELRRRGEEFHDFLEREI